MAIERVGYRRLYDSIGCTLANQEELKIEFPMGNLQFEVYLGPKPKLGITIANSSKYAVSEELSSLLTAEYKKDATQSGYPRHFFTEILCYKQIEVSQQLSTAFRAKEPNSHDELLRLAEDDAKHFKTMTDLIAGIIGLRFHRQFVLEIINENFFVNRGNDDFAFNISGSEVEVLETVTLNSNGIDILSKLLPAIGQKKPQAQEDSATALSWLLRAWTERDIVSKFMALFIPIEIILAGHKGELNKDNQEKAELIRNLIVSHGGSGNSELLNFFNNIMSQQRPSLASRFEAMAKAANLQGWEADVKAFRRFNSLRNKLLHQGEQEVKLAISVDENFKDETHELEDLAERYVNWTLFEDAAVYTSRWRPKRI